MQIFTVGEITGHIRQLFAADPRLKDVWVRGEVSNLTKARSGHWYFTLKDAKSQLRCVMFRFQAQHVRIAVQAGAEVQVHGRIGVYDARGEYQLYADSIEALGGRAALLARGSFINSPGPGEAARFQGLQRAASSDAPPSK